MKKLLLPFLLSFIIAGELEVDGNLTVTGDIVSPTIDALRDDGNYEIKILNVFVQWVDSYSGYIKAGRWLDLEDFPAVPVGQNIGSGSYYNDISTLPATVSSLFNDGWILESIDGDNISWWIFKRAINE